MVSVLVRDSEFGARLRVRVQNRFSFRVESGFWVWVRVGVRFHVVGPVLDDAYAPREPEYD